MLKNWILTFMPAKKIFSSCKDLKNDVEHFVR